MSKWDVERAVMRDTRGRDDRAWVLAIPPLPAPARHVMHVLLSRADADTAVVPGEHAPSLTELATLTGLDRSTVRRQLNNIETAGWVVRHRPDPMDARMKGVTTWYELRIPGQGVGAQCPHVEAQSPQVGAEDDGGRGTAPPIPSPDQSDLDQSNAAAGGQHIDQQGEGGDPNRTDETITLAGLNPRDPTWRPLVTAALERGCTPTQIAAEMRRDYPGARNIEAVRRAALDRLTPASPLPAPNATQPAQPTPPDPEPPTRPPPDLPHLPRGTDPTPLATTAATYDTNADPVGHAMAVLSRPTPPAPAAKPEHDPHACMDCGKPVPTSRKPWISRRTGTLVLYCLICTRKEG